MSVRELTPRQVKRAVMRPLALACLAGAAWMLLGHTTRVRLAEAAARVEAQHLDVEEFRASAAALPKSPKELIADTNDRLAQLDALSGVAQDTPGLYDAIAGLARESGLSVERIEPRQAPASTRAGHRGAAQAVESIGFSIELTGSFAGVARFVDELQSRVGLTRVAGLRLRPTVLESAPDGDVLSVTVETTHFRLNGGFLKEQDESKTGAGTPRGAKQKAKGAR